MKNFTLISSHFLVLVIAIVANTSTATLAGDFGHSFPAIFGNGSATQGSNNLTCVKFYATQAFNESNNSCGVKPGLNNGTTKLYKVLANFITGEANFVELPVINSLGNPVSLSPSHIARRYNGDLYILRNDGTLSYRVYNPTTNVIGPVINITGISGTSGHNAVTFLDDNTLLIGTSSGGGRLITVNVNTNIGTVIASAPVSGGDLEVVDGEIYLATRVRRSGAPLCTGQLMKLVGSSFVHLADIPANVTGLGKTPNGKLVTTHAFNSKMYIFNLDGTGAGELNSLSGGSEFVQVNGDLSSYTDCDAEEIDTELTLTCIDPFNDPFPKETHVKHAGGIITEIFEPEGLEIGIVPVPRAPLNDQVGESMFALNRSVENRLQTGLASVAGGSRRGHLKFMGPGPSPQPIRRADAVIANSKLTLTSNDRCASELKLLYPDVTLDPNTPIANLSGSNEFVFTNFTNPGGTQINVTLRLTSHTAGIEKNRTVAFSMQADGDYVIPFASFLPTIDFANITRIVLTINSPIESDWSLDGFCARAAVAYGRSAAIKPQVREVENEVLTMAIPEATLYPVPAADKLTVAFDVTDHIAIPYSISDLTGKILDCGTWYTQDGNKLELPVGKLSNGMYLLTYHLNGATKAYKFIIRK